jgi:hypothetical protein
MLLAAAAGATVALAGCGGGGTSEAWALGPTRECLKTEGARLVPITGDFVASTATNGALKVKLPYNNATIVFGADDDEAERLRMAYARFGPRNYVAPTELNRNALIVWSVGPSDQEAQTVRECLRF